MTTAMPAPPPPSTEPGPPKGAGSTGIWVGIVLIVLGLVGGIALIVSGARNPVSGVADLERMPLDGGSIQVREAGTITVYGERDVARSAPTTFSSSTSGGPVPEIDVTVVGPGGRAVVIEPVAGSEEYQSDGHWGTRIGRFEASQPGRYTVAASGGADVASYDGLALGDVHPKGLWLIVAGVLGGGVVAFAGLLVVILSAIRRGRAIKRARPAAMTNPGGYPPPPPTGASSF